jgi:hypothetical protein
MKEDESMEIKGNYNSNHDEEKVEYDDRDGDDDGDDDDSDDNTLYELTIQQEEAMEKLSTIFRTLNIDSIHDQ